MGDQLSQAGNRLGNYLYPQNPAPGQGTAVQDVMGAMAGPQGLQQSAADVGEKMWPTAPQPSGQMTPFQRLGYATAGPEGVQKVTQDIRAQARHTAEWAQQHPDEFAQMAALSFAGADITADVPGGISGRAILGPDQSGGDHYKHFPVLDKETGRQVGYLDAHVAHDPTTGKKLVHVDMLSVRGGHNLLPVFRQMRDLFPEAEGVLAQRISGLGNTAGFERTYLWPRAFREGAAKVQGPSFTGMKEIGGAAQTGAAKEELARTAAGAPTAPGAPAPRPSGPQPPGAAVPEPGAGGRALSDIMLTPPARDPRAPLSSTEAAAAEPYPSWMAREHPTEDAYGPRADQRQQEWARAMGVARAQAAAPLAATTGPRPNLPHWNEWVASAPYRDRGMTYSRWLQQRFPEEGGGTPPASEAERLLHGEIESPSGLAARNARRQALREERLRAGGGGFSRPLPEAAGGPELHVRRGMGAPPFLDEYLAQSPQTRHAHYSDWLAANHPEEWERRYERPLTGETAGQVREDDPARTRQAVQHLGGQPAPYWREYLATVQRAGSTAVPGEAVSYADWLQQHHPEEARVRYGLRSGQPPDTGELERLQRTPGTPENAATIQAARERAEATPEYQAGIRQGERAAERARQAPPAPDPRWQVGQDPTTGQRTAIRPVGPTAAESEQRAARQRQEEYQAERQRPGNFTLTYPEFLRQREARLRQEGQALAPPSGAAAAPARPAAVTPPSARTEPSFTGPRPVADFRRGEGFGAWMRRTHPEREMPNDEIRQEYDRLRVREWRARTAAARTSAERIQQRLGEARQRVAAAAQPAAADPDLPHYQEYYQDQRMAGPGVGHMSFPDWLRRTYPDEAERRYGPATQYPTQPSFSGPQQEGRAQPAAARPPVPSESFEAWFARRYPGEALTRQSRERLASLIREWGSTAQQPRQPAAAPTP